MEIAPSETDPDLSISSSTNSSIWAGYVEQAPAAFTAVSGTFTVPPLQTSPANNVSPWIGIDGNGNGTVIQSGVTASVEPPQNPDYEAWWETYPTNSPQDQFQAAPGDSITVNIGRATDRGK